MDEKKKEKGQFSGKLKEGVSMHEIESFARKYITEVLLVIAIFVGAISSMFDFFSGAGWSIAFAGLGAIISVALPEMTMKFVAKVAKFFTKSDRTLQIVIGVVRILIALFLPFILFGVLGLLAGTAFHYLLKKEPHFKASLKKEEHTAEEHEEEHL